MRLKYWLHLSLLLLVLMLLPLLYCVAGGEGPRCPVLFPPDFTRPADGFEEERPGELEQPPGSLEIALEEKLKIQAALTAKGEKTSRPGFEMLFAQATESAEGSLAEGGLNAKSTSTCPEEDAPAAGAAQPAPAPEPAAPAPAPAPPEPEASSTEPAPEPAPAPPKEASSQSSKEQEMINLINSARQSAGVPALAVSNRLSEAARAKSADMVNLNYFGHSSPTYGRLDGLLASFGIGYSCAGENIAMNTNGSVSAAFNSLMNSPDHRANILDRSFTQVGVGVKMKGDGSCYFTQLFVAP